MTGTVRLVLVCLALGCTTTTVVAWLLSLDIHRAMVPMRFAVAAQTASGQQTVSRRDSFGCIALAAAVSDFVPAGTPEQWVELGAIVPGWARGELLDWTPLGNSAARGILATGWPMLSLWTSYDQQPSPGYWWYKARNGVVFGPPPAAPNPFAPLSPRERTLATRIIWHGFAVSMLFWSLAWAIALRGPGIARRTYRRRRNRCPACGYPRAGLADAGECPECGSSRDS